MASPKRPTLAQSGIEKMFQTTPVPSAVPPTSATSGTPGAPAEASAASSWDATHRRRTFHCDNAVWERLAAWCTETGTSRSAAITQAIEQFLVDRTR